MKIRIANILDSTARALLAAGTLGVPAVLMGQTTPYSFLGRPAPLAHGAEEVKAPSPTAKNPRLIEMKVELAWLADPLTSPCRLEARTAGSTLEVHGQVPNDAVLAHALQLAGEESGMRVASKVQLNPRLRAGGGGKPQEVLHREAFNALCKGFPEQAPSISISTLADGQIVLKGTVPTYEDKLAISRHLRQATACNCVMNQLRVLAEPQKSDGQTQSVVGTPRVPWSATATLLPPEPLKPQPVQPVAHVQSPESSWPHPFTETTGTTGAGESPPGVKASAGRMDFQSVSGSEKSSSSRSTAQAEPASTPPAAQPQPTTAAKPAAKPLVYQTKWRRLDPSELALPKKAVPVATSKQSASAATQQTPATPYKPQTYLPVVPSPNEDRKTPSSGSVTPTRSISEGNGSATPTRSVSEGNAPAKTETAALAKQSFPLSSSTDQSAVSTAAASAPTVVGTLRVPSQLTPQSAVASVANPSPAPAPRSQTPLGSQTPVRDRPAARPRLPSVAKREPYVTDGVVLIESAIKPAAHSVPVTGQKPPAVLRTGPYVTNGVILLSDSTNDGGLNPNPVLAALQTRLQERIAAVCGKSSKEVAVTAVTETNVSVRVKAYNTMEGEELSNRIFQLPELGPCQVSLDVLVMK